MSTQRVIRFLPCPFCGGPAEMDTQRGYLTMPGGKLDNAVAIYCTECSAEQSICRADHRDLFVDDLIFIVTEAWNKRPPLTLAAPDLLAAIKNSDDAHWTPAMREAMQKARGRLLTAGQCEVK